MIKLIINQERCKACGLCSVHCPKDNLKNSDQMNEAGYHYIVQSEEEACTGCGLCALMCPDVAIEIYRIDDGGGQNE